MQYYPTTFVCIIFYLRPGIPASTSFRDVPCKRLFGPRHGRAPVCMPGRIN